jgi:hypothetical protein
MNSVSLIFSIGVTLIALSVAAAAVFLILVLIGARKAAIEFENAIKRIRNKLDVFDKVSAKVASISKKSPSLVISGISFFFYIFLRISKRKRKK